jgi:DNA-binding MarR family transcriptional regulator
MKRTRRSPSNQPAKAHGRSRANPARDLAILSAIADHRCVTQRQIAADARIAVSLANQTLQRLASDGLITITRLGTTRLRYSLTAEGMEHRQRLAHVKMCTALAHYREVRGTLRAALQPLLEGTRKRIALYGCGEVAELAYLLLKRHGCEVSSVFEARGGGWFLGLPVQGMPEVRPEEFESIIITLVDDHDAEPILAALVERGVSQEQILTISPHRARSWWVAQPSQLSGDPAGDSLPPA